MKSCLIVEGGGMKCAHSAGVLDRFIDENITFDEVIGVSAGAANAASYLAGQRGRNLRFYTTHMHEPEYMGVKNFILHGQYFNLQYIYGTLTNKDGADAIDYPAVCRNPAELYITATEAESGCARYFSKTEMNQDDYRAIMAGCCLPVMCRPIEIDGRHYYDGGVADSIPIEKALADGCDKIVLLLANERGFVRQPQKYKVLYHILLHKFPETVKKIDSRYLRYRKTLDFIMQLEKEGRVFVICPSDLCGVTTSSMDDFAHQKLYEQGIRDFESVKDALYSYLNKSE
ncbi:MAG TPA: patatin family protein [Methanocorpusculum sp.]|nr:patatin family protein [Methanocorpusculum sp.]